jgi:membrane protease subunit HflC
MLESLTKRIWKLISSLRAILSHPLGRWGALALMIAVAALVYATCTTVVTQGDIVVMMRFGKPVRVIVEPGLYLKLPAPIHRLQTFDGRLRMLEPRPSEFLTNDKKNVILDNAICYRIDDPIMFMQTVRDTYGLDVRLTDLLSSHTGLLLGVKELSDIVNTDPGKIKFQAVNAELTELMQQEGRKLGIDVKQVFIKRVMLPEENMQAVYERMRAERSRIARKYLAEGEQTAQEIRAEADKLSREIVAGAERQAAILRGQAEAQAMKIYGETYEQNVDFYTYTRALEAYRNMFNDNTVIILDEDSPILETLFSGAPDAQ